MILYHFRTSPFAIRVRLVLAQKGLSAELRDARANPEFRDDVHRLNPLHTVPVLIDGERVICDSSAICHYLDRKVPDPPLWPSGLAGAEAFELVALADGALGILVDLGLRYHSLHDHPEYPAVRTQFVGRAQRALDRLAERVAGRVGDGDGPLFGDRWSGADIAVYSAVVWLEGVHTRAATFPPAKQVVELGWTLPPSLSAWAERHRTRAEVRALA